MQRLSCPQGHTWEVEDSAGEVCARCPQCGALSDTLAPREEPSAPAVTVRTLLQAPPLPPPVWPAVPGCQVLEELGRGGAGVVYKALQPDLGRLVAVKMLVSGAAAGEAERQRFQGEARAAAGLQHPNIVRIYQVGESAGRPFLVMEYLAGGPLSARIRREPQPPRRSAELLRTLAGAVHFAHRHGILHRDLKPGNVLLEQDGTPKVADFGLAKRLDSAVPRGEGAGADDEADALTPTGAVLGTPAYMAPEQAGGPADALGPATDVYGLGAILYELLTGRPPFRGASAVETILRVRNEEPVAPRRLEPAVPRDLETICLKCLEKSPRARYATAGELADDLGRFLAGEPIRARPVGRLGRALKWARRRPAEALLVAVSTAALAVLVGGLAWHQLQIGEKNRQLGELVDVTRTQSRRHVELLRTSLQVIEEHGDFADEQLRPLPHAEQVRRQILERRLRLYEPILAQAPGDTPMRHTQGLAYLALGIIRQRLRRYAEADEAYRQALDRFEQSTADEPTPPHRHDLARALVQAGTLWEAMGRDGPAEEALRRGQRLLEQLTAEDPNPDFRRALGTAGHNLAHFLHHTGRFDDARAAYRSVIDLRRRLADEHPEDDRYLWDLFASQNNLGALYLSRLVAVEGTARDGADRARAAALAKETRAAFDEARAVLRKLEPRHGDGVEYRTDLAGLYLNLGILDGERAPAEARKAYRAAVPLWQGLHADFPSVPQYTQKAADAVAQLGLLLESSGRLPEAREALARALELYEELERQSPEEPAGRDGVNQLLHHLGRVLLASGRNAEGERLLQRAADRLRALAGRSAGPRASRDLAITLNLLGDVYKAKGEVRRSVPLPTPALEPHQLGPALGEIALRYSWQGLLGRAAAYYGECLEQTRRAAAADAHAPRYYFSLSKQALSLAAVAEMLASYPDMVRAAEAMEESAGRLAAGNPGGLRHLLAALYQGRCSALAAADDRLPAPRRGERAAEHARRGLRLVDLALQNGYRDTAKLRTFAELEPVRRLCADDFARLIDKAGEKK